MYDTDFGTTVLSVAHLFRNMSQRYEDLVNAENPPPPSMETPGLSGNLVQQTNTSKSAFPVDMNVTGQGMTDARTASNTPAAEFPTHDAAADNLVMCTSRVVDVACPASSAHLLHLVQSAPTVEAGQPDTVEIVSQTAPRRDSTGYSAAPPDGYGIAAQVSGSLHLSRLSTDPSLEAPGDANATRVQAAGVSTHTPDMCIPGEESGAQPGNVEELPSGFPSFEALLHHGMVLSIHGNRETSSFRGLDVQPGRLVPNSQQAHSHKYVQLRKTRWSRSSSAC